MNDPKALAERLFSESFSQEELQFLRVQPCFIKATQMLETPGDALRAVDTGHELIKAATRSILQRVKIANAEEK